MSSSRLRLHGLKPLLLLHSLLFPPFLEQKLAHDEFAALHPGDQDGATRAFVAFTGMFGQVCKEC